LFEERSRRVAFRRRKREVSLGRDPFQSLSRLTMCTLEILGSLTDVVVASSRCGKIRKRDGRVMTLHVKRIECSLTE
jgi:hypothetical protein